MGGDVSKECGHCRYKMMMIGPTGSGKTSLVNLLCNMQAVQKLGSGLADADLRDYHNLKLEDVVGKEIQSRIQDAWTYLEVEFDNVKVQVIDTPGLGDTGGLTAVEENVDKIKKRIQRESYLNCICSVINGLDVRMTKTLKYVLNEISAIMPKEIVESYIVVFTHARDILELNFQVSELSTFLGKDVMSKRVFYVDNPYCKVQKAREQDASDEEIQEQVIDSLRRRFRDTADMLESLCAAARSFQPVYTNAFMKLYSAKQTIDRSTIELLASYTNQVNKETYLKRVKEEYCSAQASKSLNADLKAMRTELRWEKRWTETHNTLCAHPGCHSNCHAPCALERCMDKAPLMNCWAFLPKEQILGIRIEHDGNREICGVCGHSYQEHHHDTFKWQAKTHEVRVADDTMQASLTQAESEEEQKRVLQEFLNQQIDESKALRKDISTRLLLIIEEVERLGLARNKSVLEDHRVLLEHHHVQAYLYEDSADAHGFEEHLAKIDEMIRAVDLAKVSSPSRSA